MQNNITRIACLLLEGYTAKLRPLVFFLLKTSSIFLSQLLTLNVLDESYFRNGPDTLNWIYMYILFNQDENAGGGGGEVGGGDHICYIYIHIF